VNPMCPNCGEMLKLKWINETYGGEAGVIKVRNRFWVCDKCRRSPRARLLDLKWRWKVGEEAIRRPKKKKEKKEDKR